eukprot:gene12881-biopygen12823
MSGIRVEDIDDEHGQHNIPPSVWGPPLWKSIHYVALGYPANPTPEERRVYKTFFDQILEHLIPCHVCSENYHRHLVELRDSPYLTGYNVSGGSKAEANITGFMRRCSHFIFDNFSNKQYPDFLSGSLNLNMAKVPRPNHGSGNHVRQMFFGMLIQHNMMAMHKKAYAGVLGIDKRKLSGTDILKRYLALVGGSAFMQVARMGEYKTLNQNIVLKFKNGSFRYVYELLSDNTQLIDALVQDKYLENLLGIQNVYSMAIYRLVMRRLLDPSGTDKCIRDFIDTVALLGVYYIDETVYNNVVAEPLDPSNQMHSFLIMNELRHVLPKRACLGVLPATIRALKKRMEAVTIHAIAVSLDFTGDTAGVECTKVKTTYQKARSVRIYGDTKERIQLLTNFDSIFRLFFGHVYNGLAVLEVKLTTPLNPVLKAYQNKTIRYDIVKDLGIKNS